MPPLFPVSVSSLKTMQMEDCQQSLITGENGKRVAASVLRRTLSAAEMCSKSWRAQGGAIKKTASVEHLQSLVHDEEDGNGSGSGSGAFDEVWSSIQRKTENSEKKEMAVDVWGSILSEKKGNDDVAPAQYVHPLVKRSASSLSEKSLEICTESLGSETGADGFSFLDSEKEAVITKNVMVGKEVDEVKKPGQQVEEEEKEMEMEMGRIVEEEEHVARVDFAKHSVAKRATAGEGRNRSFPPPLLSLGHREDGTNVQMRCHRQDGRLVVEAVSVPSRNCFRAERQDGRLLLTFSGEEENPEFGDQDDEEEEEISDEWEEEEEEEELEEGEELAMENEYERGGMMMMMKYVDHKFLCLTRSSPPAASCAHRLNKVVPNLDDVAKSIADSKGMGRIIPVTAITRTLNPYMYGWRSVSGGGVTVTETKEGFVGGGGCNGQVQQEPPRRSLLLWSDATRCIATS